MRKGFTEENSKEMEVVLKIRVPQDFDEEMESQIDGALADTLYDLGCELVDSKEYQDVPGWRKDDGLDRWRRMVIDELDVNDDIYELSPEEKSGLLNSVEIIDRLANQMEICMQRGDRNEYEALEIVFQRYFPDILKEFREGNIESLVEGLNLFCDASIDGGTLFIDCWAGDSVEIFLADDGGLLCLLPDEDEPRALRDRIQDVEPGDAFLFGGGGSIRTASEAAHQNFDEPDNPWILYGDDGDCYFEEDFGCELGADIREILEKLPAREEVYYDVPEYPLRHYDDAVRLLCEILNNRDEEIDLDDNWTPLKLEEFIPIFKSENYFGIYCWHDDGNEYYLVDRNTGTHTMVLSDSFEFVGKNTLDCMKDEKVLHVANTEWLKYLVEFSLQNVQGVVPEQDLRGIAVLEAAFREAVKKEGKIVLGPSLTETLDAAKERAMSVGDNSKNNIDLSQEI